MIVAFSPTWPIAQTVSVSDDGRTIIFRGEITKEAAPSFLSALVSAPNAQIVSLDSPGGLVYPALDVASAIFSAGLSTEVLADGFCASACSIIFFAGIGRQALGPLGVHQMSYNDQKAAGADYVSDVQFTLAEVLDAFEAYGVSRDISRIMLTTAPEDMHFFTELEETRFGVNRDITTEMADREIVRSAAAVAFADFPPDHRFDFRTAVVLPDFAGRDEWARMFRTRIREGMASGPNFAGHYAIIEIGCGTSCRFGYIADVETGEVYDFPYGGEENYEMMLLFNDDSKLIKITWTEDWTTCVQQDVVFDRGSYEIINEVRIPRQDFCNSAFGG